MRLVAVAGLMVAFHVGCEVPRFQIYTTLRHLRSLIAELNVKFFELLL
jgi:hypothetical protein